MSCLHIYCGDGKGKTTASIGLAVRAAGAGMSVAFVQLMKGSYTSELEILKNIKGITVSRCDRNYGFYKNMSENDIAEITACHDRLLRDAFSGGYDMIILDEFNSAYAYGLMDRTAAEKYILDGGREIILTGRNPDKKFTDAADYVSEIKCVKHPFITSGLTARKGIEY